jgi:hypothetical protein
MHNLRSLYALIAVQTVGLIATLALVVVVFMGSIDSVSSEQLAACQATNITRALENISHLADDPDEDRDCKAEADYDGVRWAVASFHYREDLVTANRLQG